MCLTFLWLARNVSYSSPRPRSSSRLHSSRLPLAQPACKAYTTSVQRGNSYLLLEAWLHLSALSGNRSGNTFKSPCRLSGNESYNLFLSLADFFTICKYPGPHSKANKHEHQTGGQKESTRTHEKESMRAVFTWLSQFGDPRHEAEHCIRLN